jgi:hypothetical protein
MTEANVASVQAQGRGLDWLVAKQAADGGWHSTTYGQLKDGAGVTSLVLEAIGHAATAVQQKHLGVAKKAYAFLDRGIAKRGTVASPDGSLDFPTYAAALWLTSRRRMSLSLPNATRQTLEEYLLGAQVNEGRGFKADSPSYGGWDFLAKEDAEAITTGTNISVTRYVVESLAGLEMASGGRQPPETVRTALELAQKYVLRCQQPDGGFAFTCEPASLNNKAAYEDEDLKKPRPYATATCDGILALIACGAKPDDAHVAKAVAWLVKRPALELVPGFEGLPPEAGWQRGLRFYYYAGLARVLPLFPPAERDARREALHKHVIALQQNDGSWVNESDRMRENDPLVATALAVMALAH